jgi:hypothetical protein
MASSSRRTCGAFVLLIVVSAGCSKTAEERLVGTWVLDLGATKAVMQLKQIDVEGSDVLQKYRGTKNTIEFQNDGTFVLSTSKAPSAQGTGKWEVVSENGATVNVKLLLSMPRGMVAAPTMTFDGDNQLIVESETFMAGVTAWRRE